MVQEQKIRTIQLTSKIWKVGQAIGVILLIVGVIGLFRAYFVRYFAELNQAINDWWFQQSNAAHFRSKDFTGCSVSEATTRTFV
jgi:multisubunit Na+/H+ antiporter MnhB subunit